MRFTDGFWQIRPGVTALYAQEAYDIWETTHPADGAALQITAPTARITKRGDVLNRPTLTVTLSSPLAGVIRVRITHHEGGLWHGGYALPGAVAGAGQARVTDADGILSSGALTARVTHGAPWSLAFELDGKTVTASGHKSASYIRLTPEGKVGSQELYEIYTVWCRENGFSPLKNRSFSEFLIANQKKYSIEHSNNLTNLVGRRVWGFTGIKPVLRLPLRTADGWQRDCSDDNPFV